MRPTLIYTGGGGRLGNQLIRQAHWQAWSTDEEIKLVNMAFWPYSSYFCASRRLPRFSRRTEWRWQKLIKTVGQLIPWPSIQLEDGEHLDLEDSSFADLVRCRRFTTCHGWRISCWKRFKAQQDKLRWNFRINKYYRRLAGQWMDRIRSRFNMVIGLLIRQDDYRVWRDGQFHFPTFQYVKWIRQVLDLYPKAAVVIASDEHQAPALFDGLPCHFATGSMNEGGHWFESFAQLSMCDLILSPPSTFSAAAAFVGNIPLWPLVSMNQELNDDQIMADAMINAWQHPVFSLAVK